MNQRMSFLVAATTAALLVSAAAQSKPKTYTWKQFFLQYPSDWVVDRDVYNQKKKQKMVRLTSTRTSARPVAVMLVFTPDPPAPDKKYLQRPSLTALSFGFPLAKKAAGADKGDKTFVGYDQVQLGDGPAPAARVIIPRKDGKTTANVHTFVRLERRGMILGAVITTGVIGQVIEDFEFHKAIGQAYGILRSIHIAAK